MQMATTPLPALLKMARPNKAVARRSNAAFPVAASPTNRTSSIFSFYPKRKFARKEGLTCLTHNMLANVSTRRRCFSLDCRNIFSTALLSFLKRNDKSGTNQKSHEKSNFDRSWPYGFGRYHVCCGERLLRRRLRTRLLLVLLIMAGR